MNTSNNAVAVNDIDPAIDSKADTESLVVLTIEQLMMVGGGQDIVNSN